MQTHEPLFCVAGGFPAATIACFGPTATAHFVEMTAVEAVGWIRAKDTATLKLLWRYGPEESLLREFMAGQGLADLLKGRDRPDRLNGSRFERLEAIIVFRTESGAVRIRLLTMEPTCPLDSEEEPTVEVQLPPEEIADINQLGE